MANVFISNPAAPAFALPAAAAFNGSEIFAMDQTVGGVLTTVGGTMTQLETFLSASGAFISAINGTANQIVATTVAGVTTLKFASNVVIPAPPSGVALSVTAFAGQPAITTTTGGMLQNNVSGVVALAMNSSGTDFGQIWNVGTQLWALGHGPNSSTPGTNSLKWNATAGGSVFIGDGSNTTTLFGGAGRATLQINSSVDGIVEFVNNGAVTANGYLYCSTGELRLNAFGAGAIQTIYTANIPRGQWNGTGGLTILAPTSGTWLSAAASTTTQTYATLGNVNVSIGQFIAANFTEIISTNTNPTYIGNNQNASVNLCTQSIGRLGISGVGNVSIAAPSTGFALSVNGNASASAVNISGGGSSNAALFINDSSRGIQIQAGSTSGNFNSVFQNAAGSLNLMLLYGDGSLVVGNPSGGPLGIGTINLATGAFINGVAIGATTGTFTAGTTGLSGATAACAWTKVGNTVTLFIGVTSSLVSNAVTFTFTGLPAVIQPATAKWAAGTSVATNSGGQSANGGSFVSGSTITNWFSGSVNGWTATGNKGLGDTARGVTLVYDVT